LSLTDNLVVDLDPLQGLANLRTLTLASNAVRDIKPLADNPALATGSSLILAGNPLSVLSRTTYVRAMQDRGATVTADAFVVTFADSLLEVGIRAALMQPEGNLLHPDLETLTVLDVATDFTSLSGLEFVRDLVDLDLLAIRSLASRRCRVCSISRYSTSATTRSATSHPWQGLCCYESWIWRIRV
jgi:Leucine-rich repeat (LRR) protein